MTNNIRNFRQKLKDDFVLGVFSKTSDPAFIEIMGHSGIDFVIIDLEHSPNSVQTVQSLIRAAEVAKIFPVVRVKEDNSSIIGEVLDIGAGGIQVPQINDSEMAEEIIRLSRFSPEGMRGVCRFVRAADYSSMDRFRYFKEANETVIILQLEGEEAIRNIDGILDVPGADIIFVGPYDLSQSLGVPGEIDHPVVVEKMKEIVEKSIQKGAAVGTFVDTIENAEKWRELGVKYISYSVDVGIFYEKCVEIVQKIRAR
ncbi:MAG: aldolase [Spirochaetes bacterium]|nr:aldolase [Spirochaetota bacterium]